MKQTQIVIAVISVLMAISRPAASQEKPTKEAVRTAIAETATVVAVGKFIWDNRADIGRTIAEITGGVTSIKKVVNNTPHEVVLWKRDVKPFEKDTQEVKVPAGKTVECDFWIPWADDANQFKDHKMVIKVKGKPLAWVWQSGDKLRVNTGEFFVKDASGVPGESKPGGDRHLYIEAVKEKGKTIGFVIHGAKQKK